MAVATSLACIKNGEGQVECTINGLGERAGKEIPRAGKMVADITRIMHQPNKAIVGENAFAHESSIHQDRVLKDQETYETMKLEDIGLADANTIVLGKLSDSHAFVDKIVDLGFKLNYEEINASFECSKLLAYKIK